MTKSSSFNNHLITQGEDHMINMVAITRDHLELYITCKNGCDTMVQIPVTPHKREQLLAKLESAMRQYIKGIASAVPSLTHNELASHRRGLRIIRDTVKIADMFGWDNREYTLYTHVHFNEADQLNMHRFFDALLENVLKTDYTSRVDEPKESRLDLSACEKGGCTISEAAGTPMFIHSRI